jgi:hypothetical protein
VIGFCGFFPLTPEGNEQCGSGHGSGTCVFGIEDANRSVNGNEIARAGVKRRCLRTFDNRRDEKGRFATQFTIPHAFDAKRDYVASLVDRCHGAAEHECGLGHLHGCAVVRRNGVTLGT